MLPLHFNAIHELYPPVAGDDKRPSASVSIILPLIIIIVLLKVFGTDEIFICPTRFAARAFSNQMSKVSPVYHYIFDHVLSFKQGWEPDSLYHACKNSSCKVFTSVE